jgi:fluoride ion exporter CrcB/FEX
VLGFYSLVSSWNTQMVVMMDGTGITLGPQIASALFGYIIGISCSLSSFNFGRNLADWVRRIHVANDYVLPTLEQQDTQSTTDTYNKHDKKRHQQRQNIKALFEFCNRLHCVQYGAQVIAMIFVVAFLVGDFVNGVQSFRIIWLSLLFTPFGSLLRWRLSHLNVSGIQLYNMQWFPLGTFICNVLASAVSISVAAVQLRLNQNDSNTVWNIAVLAAISAGMSGSTSTVSTLMKEMADATPTHAFIYCFVTILCTAAIGLILYRPIVG